MAALMERGVGSSSSSSASSDDETEPSGTLQRFQEAAVTAEYISDLCQWKKFPGAPQKTKDSQLKSSLPSKRCVSVDEHEDENPLGTTPEFKAFVAKKLAEKLDREIEFCSTETPASEYASWINQDINGVQEGVRLFSDSSHVLCDTDEVPSQPRPQKPRHHRARNTTSDSYSCEAERLAAVAVTADFLAEERAMWARLRQSSLETAGKQASTTSAADNSIQNPGASQHETRREKKKKKKAKDSRERTDSKGSVMTSATEHSSHKEKTDDGAQKKKRKMKDRSLSLPCVSENGADKKRRTDAENNNCEKPVKKKKKRKNSENDRSARIVADAENGNCGENPRKKKKNKSIVESTHDTSEETSSAKTTNNVIMNCEQETKKKKKDKNLQDGDSDFKTTKLNCLTGVTSQYAQERTAKNKKQKKQKANLSKSSACSSQSKPDREAENIFANNKSDTCSVNQDGKTVQKKKKKKHKTVDVANGGV